MQDTLSHFPLFSQLSDRERVALEKKLKTNTFRAGQNIIRQGEPCLHAYILLQGKVEISSISTDGSALHILFHQAPAFFGMIEIFRELPYLGTVTAIEPSTTLSMTKAQYLGLLHSSHQMCLSVIQNLSDQVYQSGIDHRMRLFGDTEKILGRFLLCQAEACGEKKQDGVFVPVSLNKSQIAKSLGLSRRHVIRSFQALEKRGIIEVQSGRLFVPNLSKLKELSEKVWSGKERRHFRR